MKRVMSLWTRFREATGIGWAGMAWIVAAIGVAAGALMVLSAASEDVVRHNGLAILDPARLHWFILHRPDTAVTAARIATTFGDPAVLIAVALGASFWLWRRGERLILALSPILAIGMAGAAATITKAIVGRPRPPVGLHLVVETEPSFPSGHATDSTALYLAIALVVAIAVLRSPRARVLVVTAALALAAMIGLSRLTLGVHWPSDVIAGWALGTFTAVTVVTVSTIIARTEPTNSQSHRTRFVRIVERGHGLAHIHRGQRLTVAAKPGIA